MQKQKNFTGFPGDCSDQQIQVLKNFRSIVVQMGCTDPIYDDAYLLRFLRARKFDLQKTTDMWTNYINWRKQKNVDQIYATPMPEMKAAKKYYPHLWFRTDKVGRPIFIERVGKLQLDKLQKQITTETLEKHFIQDYERLIREIFPACSKVKGEPVLSTLYIMDLKGAAAKMMNSKIMDILKMASKIGQDFYPETLGQMYIVNAPMFFYGVWNIVKHFVDEKTRNKIHIMGSGFKKDLSKHVADENLPDFLGGSVTQADYGEHFDTEQGPWVVKATGAPENDEIYKQISQAQENETDEGEVSRPSIEIKDDVEIDDPFTDCSQSVPVINEHRFVQDIKGRDCFDIANESPLKVRVKNFKPKPSISFTTIRSLNDYI